jgi:hypothetical protein
LAKRERRRLAKYHLGGRCGRRSSPPDSRHPRHAARHDEQLRTLVLRSLCRLLCEWLKPLVVTPTRQRVVTDGALLVRPRECTQVYCRSGRIALHRQVPSTSTAEQLGLAVCAYLGRYTQHHLYALFDYLASLAITPLFAGRLSSSDLQRLYTSQGSQCFRGF